MDQKVVLFIGVCDDISISSIIEFAKLGHRIAVASHMNDALDRVQAYNASNYLIEIADFKDIQNAGRAITETVERFGRIDKLVINSSQIGEDRRINHEGFYNDFRDVLQVNLMFATRIAQLAEPYLIQTKGSIVIVSVVDRPSLSFCVAQAGLLMLNKTLANSFAHKEVRINAIIDSSVGESCSQIVYEDIQESRKTDLIDELVKFIIFLGSDEASFVHGSIFKLKKHPKIQHIRSIS